MADNGNIATFTTTLVWETYKNEHYVQTAGFLSCQLTIPVNYAYLMVGTISTMILIVYTPTVVENIKSTTCKLWKTMKKFPRAVVSRFIGQD